VAVIARAAEIDALGRHWEESRPTFFRRTSVEVCRAIASVDEPNRKKILERHVARIEDHRLRRAFRAAMDLEQSPSCAKTRRPGLWDGLSRRRPPRSAE
jgi:hypothetical protein